MKTRLTPIAGAVSAFLISTVAWAAGGNPGDPGASHANGAPITLVGAAELGTTGNDLTQADGGDAASVNGNNIALQGTDATTPLQITGDAGLDGGSTSAGGGGGGAGGHGGSSIFGGSSQGGAGGFVDSTSSNPANAGNGGEASNNTIKAQYIQLDGTGALGGNGNGGSSSGGGSGAGGHGGGSIFGGLSSGGAGGDTDSAPGSSYISTTNGGQGGQANNNVVSLSDSELIGATGGQGGNSTDGGGGGHGGHGGASIFGGASIGGAGGDTDANSSAANGGNGGTVNGNSVTVTGSSLTGATAGAGGSTTSAYGGSGGGSGGYGGGSILGGLSMGGAGGFAYSTDSPGTDSFFSHASGGNGGTVSGNQVVVAGTTSTGAAGGSGGDTVGPITGTAGGGDGGHGGASVFGGISSGAAGGYAYAFSLAATTSSAVNIANGGNGGSVSNNTVTISDSTLDGTGANGGNGGNADVTSMGGSAGGGAGGHGGGSVFGGLSSGAAGGFAYVSPGIESNSSSANGGHGGQSSGNTVMLTNVKLLGNAAGGTGGTSQHSGVGGASGSDGLGGSSVFGGVSTGGAGGYVTSPTAASSTAAGGNAGNTSNNSISIAGDSVIAGDIYGGYSQGGEAGFVSVNGGPAALSTTGQGGYAQNNVITLIGEQIQITGSIYGGFSKNGDGSLNDDQAFLGNTLNVRAYSGSVKGLYNFQNYNWLLPANVANGDIIISTSGGANVAVDNTLHTVALQNDGNRLYAGDQVILIEGASGTPSLVGQVQQGHFLVYDANLEVDGANNLVLDIRGDAEVNPKAKVILEGRTALLALVNQGADMISDYGIYSARASLRNSNANLFAVMDGGSNRYKTGSHIKLHDFKLALGAAKAFELENKSAAMVGIFAEHGTGNYDSYNSFGSHGDVHGWGNVRYTGGGILFHMDVEGTAPNTPWASANIFDQRYGLYINAALRAGHAKLSFDSGDLVNAEGLSAHYNSKSKYLTAMAGVGYVWNLDEKQAVDLYGRYTWSKLNRDSVQIGPDQVDFGVAHSSRLRLGARYGYVYSPQITPYAGIAFERDFKGEAGGSVHGLSINPPSLKGNTGMVELGMLIKPVTSTDAFTMNVGLQGYFSERKGVSAAIKARYVF